MVAADTIEVVRAQIAKLMNEDVSRIRIIFAGKQLEDDRHGQWISSLSLVLARCFCCARRRCLIPVASRVCHSWQEPRVQHSGAVDAARHSQEGLSGAALDFDGCCGLEALAVLPLLFLVVSCGRCDGCSFVHTPHMLCNAHA